MSYDSVGKLLEELIDMQKKRLFALGRQIVPGITVDDLLQPNDFLELEHHPEFRYEEGILAGLLTSQTAINALKQEDYELF